MPGVGDNAAYAMDIEPRNAALPRDIVELLGAGSNDEAARLWTEAEVLAKVGDTNAGSTSQFEGAEGPDADPAG